MIHPIKHFKVITKHRHKVIYHCFKSGIFWQGIRHDLSKYLPAEFISGARFFLGTKSPNEEERRKIGFSKAWMHHQGRNKHHFEYWKDYSPKTRMIEPVKMPYKYLVEMFCDRVAASKIYLGENYKITHPLEYFEKGKETRIIHQDTSDELELLLKMIADKGEKETFKFIKKRIKSRYTY